MLSNVPARTRFSEFCNFRYSLSGQVSFRVCCGVIAVVGHLVRGSASRTLELVVATLLSRCLPTVGNRLGVDRLRGYAIRRLYALPTEH